MKTFLIFVVFLIVAVAAVGYMRGWFDVSRKGNVQVHVDSEKFKDEKAAFSKSVAENARALKDKVSSLWQKSETMSGEHKTETQRELSDLRKEHEQIEKQIRDLEHASGEHFETAKQDLARSLAEVERKTEALRKKLENNNQN